MFNGYGDQVASLYAGMDLKKNLLARTAIRADVVTVEPDRSAGSSSRRLPRRRSVPFGAGCVWAAATPATSAPTRSAISPTRPASGRCGFSASRWRSRRCAGSPAGTPRSGSAACRAVRVLLRHAALPHLHHRRSLRRASISRRHRRVADAAQTWPRRSARTSTSGRSSRSASPRWSDGAAGAHVDGRDDPAARRQALAARCTGSSTWRRSPASCTTGGW